MKTRKKLIISLFAVLLLILPVSVLAFEAKTGDVIQVNEDDIIEGNFYTAGSSISIDGTIKGDLFCGAQTVNINGTVEGDVICGAQNININGKIGGSVRVVGNTININNQVARGVQAIGATINLSKDANVGWDMFIAGATGLIQGKIDGGLHGAVASITIDGEVGRNIRLKIDDSKKCKNCTEEKSSFKITDKAKVGGDITYTSMSEGSFSELATITGETNHNLPKTNNSKKMLIIGWAWGLIYSIFAYLVLGLVLITIWKKQVLDTTENMLEKVGNKIGWGFVVLLLTPIVCLLLLITFIGVPLAFILIFVWLVAIIVSKLLFAIMIGRRVLEKMGKKSKDLLIWSMIVGVIITKILFSLPIIGWLISLLAITWGLGTLWVYFKK